MTKPDLAPRLWLLISPTLPIGGFSYSQGVEAASEAGQLPDAQAVRDWVLELASAALLHQDLACLARLYDSTDNSDEFVYWNGVLASCRETHEFREEDAQMGSALLRLTKDLAPDLAPIVCDKPTLASVFACLAQHWKIDLNQTLMAYAWMVIENQVAAAVKLVPLGQTDGQRILLEAIDKLPVLVEQSRAVCDESIGFSTPGLAILSAQHETQAFRLFRS